MHPDIELTPFGVAIVKNDNALSNMIRAAGRLDIARDEILPMGKYIPRGSTVLDIGACLGSHAATYSELVGPNGSVHCFEPHDVAFDGLLYNMIAHQCTNVSCHRIALGDSNTKGSTLRNDNLGASRVVYNVHGDFDIMRLDDLTAVDMSKLSFIKIDAEGCEPDILDGGFSTIMKYRPVLLMEVNDVQLNARATNRQEIFKRLTAMGYRWESQDPRYGIDISPQIDIICIPIS
jgi:FkbM family methyltransferase